MRQIRLDNKLKQSEMAELMGLNSHVQVSRIETGANYPSAESLVRLTEHLEVDMHWLITGSRKVYPASHTGRGHAAIASAAHQQMSFLVLLGTKLIRLADEAEAAGYSEFAKRADQMYDLISTEVEKIVNILEELRNTRRFKNENN
jgi:transcriptional regulator with XRE-family HTH domain